MDYQSLHMKTVVELRRLAKEAGVRIPAGTNKSTLIAMLLEADGNDTALRTEAKPAARRERPAGRNSRPAPADAAGPDAQAPGGSGAEAESKPASRRERPRAGEAKSKGAATPVDVRREAPAPRSAAAPEKPAETPAAATTAPTDRSAAASEKPAETPATPEGRSAEARPMIRARINTGFHASPRATGEDRQQPGRTGQSWNANRPAQQGEGRPQRFTPGGGQRTQLPVAISPARTCRSRGSGSLRRSYPGAACSNRDGWPR